MHMHIQFLQMPIFFDVMAKNITEINFSNNYNKLLLFLTFSEC